MRAFPFPSPLALSPRERENRIPSRDESERPGCAPLRTMVFPLLGERDGVRGNKSFSNPTRRTIARCVKLNNSSGRAGGLSFALLPRKDSNRGNS